MDRYRGITSLPLLEAKVSELLGRLQNNVSNGSYQTQEDLVRSYADIAARISAGTESSIYTLPKPSAGGALNGDEVNLALLGIYNEISYLVKATIGTGSLVESNFNFATSGVRELQSTLKRIKQKIAAYSLYSHRFGNSRLHGETFTNEDNIDRGSSLLKEKECNIDLAEGTASLPISNEDKWKIEKIEVGAISNGTIGNNVEVGTPVREKLTSMFDDNIDTWCEYERVVSVEDEVALKLDLKVLLSNVRIVNSIKIVPVFLGARTPMIITDVLLSEDGNSWISLKEDVRVAEFIGERPEERFHISPHSSRFTGEFNISFAPRRAKMIGLTIRQPSSFPIQDVYGTTWLRYAVGIKEIAISGKKFDSASELISKSIDMSSRFTAASIQSLVDPPLVPPEVGKVEYFLSFDDGVSWQQLTAQDEANPEIEEVLYPENEVSSLRWKVKLSKDEAAFNTTGDSVLKSIVEVHSYPDFAPASIRLGHKPKTGTVSVCDPRLAARGRLYPKMPIGTGVASILFQNAESKWERHGNSQLRLKVPLENIEDFSVINVYVNNVAWPVVSTWGGKTRLSKACLIERSVDETEDSSVSATFEVVFGNGEADNPVGMIPSVTDVISICLKTETLALDGVTAPYRAKLDFPSNGNKSDIRLYVPDPLLEDSSAVVVETIPSGLVKFKLSHKSIWIEGLNRLLLVGAYNASGTFLGMTSSYISSSAISGVAAFKQYRNFVNGSSELILAGDWTVDDINGYLYTKTPIDDGVRIEVHYYCNPVYYLTQDDWDFVQGKLDEIEIYESGYRALETSVSTMSASSKIVDLGQAGIVSKSVRLPVGTFGTAYPPFEVAFINGSQEFEQKGKVQDEPVPAAVAVGSPAIASFRLTHYQTMVQDAGISFTYGDAPSTTLFINAVVNYASLSAVGDYYLDTTGDGPNGYGYIYTVLAVAGTAIPSGFVASYSYEDEFYTERMTGAYSVNTVDGRVHLFTYPTTIGDVTFKYAKYSISYVIGKEFQEGSEWKFGDDGQTISMLTSADASHSHKLSVKYDYEVVTKNAAELGPYYSPLLRALAVEVS